MTALTVPPHPPVLVGSILRSLRTGDPRALDCALDRAERVAVPVGNAPTELDEELELIRAIATEVRAEVRRGSAPADAAAAFEPLLRNLAGRTRSSQSAPRLN